MGASDGYRCDKPCREYADKVECCQYGFRELEYTRPHKNNLLFPDLYSGRLLGDQGVQTSVHWSSGDNKQLEKLRKIHIFSKRS